MQIVNKFQSLMCKPDYTRNDLDSRALQIDIVNFCKVYLPYLVIVIYIVFSLSSLLTSGYYSDDLLNSSLQGTVGVNDTSITQIITSKISKWLTQGRLFPIHVIIVNSFAYLVTNLLAYKSIVMALIVVNILLLGKLVGKISGDRYVGFIAMLLTPILFQFRLYHDPILSFYGMPQFFVAFILSSLFAFVMYLKTNKLRFLVLSLLLYNVTLYIYEISVPLIFIYICVYFCSYNDGEKYKNLKKLLPHILSVIAYIIALIIIRQFKTVTSGSYSGITINIQYFNILLTYIIQTISSLPLSYYLANPSYIFNHSYTFTVKNVTISDLTTLFIFLCSYYYAMRKITFKNKINIFFYLGASFLLLPAIPIALTSKYQTELIASGVGMGYLPVYVQYYGTVLIGIGIMLFLKKVALSRQAVNLISSIVISVFLLINIQSNRLVVDKSNIDMHYRRVALERALKGNILENVPSYSKLIIMDDYNYDPYPLVRSHTKGWMIEGYAWKNASFVYLNTKRKFDVIGTRNEVKNRMNAINNREPIDNGYLLVIKSYPKEAGIRDGFVELYKLNGITTNSDDGLKFQTQILKTDYPLNL